MGLGPQATLRMVRGALLLMILHYLKDPNYGNYGIVLTMGYCRIYIINRAPKIVLTALVLEPLA